MASNDNVDELFEIKAAYYLGNFQQCISESQKLKVSPDLMTAKDIYMFRSYIGQKKYGVVLDEIGHGANEQLLAVRMFAEYLADDNKRLKIASQFDQKMSGNIDTSNHTFLLMAASVYVRENNPESALRALHQSDNLECLAMMVQILLQIDRVDLARKELKRMTDADEDNILSQLATAWVNIALGGDKLRDAYYIYQEFIDKHCATPLLLNGQAVALMSQGQWEEAESALADAMEKDSNNPETLANMVVLSQHLGKAPEVTNRYLSQLKDGHRGHAFVDAYLAKEQEFAKLTKNYSATVAS